MAVHHNTTLIFSCWMFACVECEGDCLDVFKGS